MEVEGSWALISMLNEGPEQITFAQSIEAIEEMCDVTPVAFSVGGVKSEAGQNMSSAKILSFGKLLSLSADGTLQLFGDYYRKGVLGNPDGTDHPNITVRSSRVAARRCRFRMASRSRRRA
eukprot:2383569-Prymnesium_polylepis.1